MNNQQEIEKLSLIKLRDSIVYSICVQGHLHLSWWDYFLGLSIFNTWDDEGQPITFLEGQLPDYNALITILNHLYTLGLPILLVEQIPVTELSHNQI
ncbi:MAG: hypothetical protein QNJ41_17250 [Xenococcaceae cyanobacterium MO_188.B32]|nr:hypothetical protein [Xenococcaceae cyanobacterium MO_188.B32]